jgi:hypothetical protein
MENGVLLEVSTDVPCPDEVEEPELEEPELEEPPDFEAFCAEEMAQQVETTARRKMVVRTDDRFIPVSSWGSAMRLRLTEGGHWLAGGGACMGLLRRRREFEMRGRRDRVWGFPRIRLKRGSWGNECAGGKCPDPAYDCGPDWLIVANRQSV